MAGAAGGEEDQSDEGGEGDDDARDKGVARPAKHGEPIDGISPGDEACKSGKGYVSPLEGHNPWQKTVGGERRRMIWWWFELVLSSVNVVIDSCLEPKATTEHTSTVTAQHTALVDPLTRGQDQLRPGSRPASLPSPVRSIANGILPVNPLC